MIPLTADTAIRFEDPLPKSVDVAIIGGGVIGVSTALYLRKMGYSVLLCDKGRVAGEQSSRNWGWVRVMLRDPAEIPIAMESLKCWEEISREVEEDIGFSRSGAIVLAESVEEMAAFEDWCTTSSAYGYSSELVTSQQIGDHVKGAVGAWSGGILARTDGRAEPFTAVPAMARLLQRLGGVVRENCAVRSIEKAGGRVSRVITEGRGVDCNAVVCATGAWSSLFLSNLDITLPQLVVHGTVARLAATAPVYEGNAGLKDIYIRRRQDGGYTVAAPFFSHYIGANSFRFLPSFLKTAMSASNIGLRVGGDITQQSFPAQKWTGESVTRFERQRILSPHPSESALRLIRKNLDRRLPVMKDVPIEQAWAGMIDAMPDVVPVMDEAPSLKGLYVATGFSGHGFGIGPAAGKIMADLVVGNKPGFDLSRFRFSRFSDGSKIVPGPAI